MTHRTETPAHTADNSSASTASSSAALTADTWRTVLSEVYELRRLLRDALERVLALEERLGD